MKKKISMALAAATLVLAFAAFGCSSTETPDNTETTDTTEATETQPVEHENAMFIGAEDIDNSLESYYTLREALDRVSVITEKYGDSNPHTSIHSTTYTCDNCHIDDAAMTVREDHMCVDCHAWPRDLQSDITKMQ